MTSARAQTPRARVPSGHFTRGQRAKWTFFWGFGVNRSVSATLPSSPSHFLYTASKREKSVAVTGRRNQDWMNSLVRLTVKRAAGCVSLLVARAPLLCSGADGGERLPSWWCLQRTANNALPPPSEREREGERGRGSRERGRERSLKMEQFVTYSCKKIRRLGAEQTDWITNSLSVATRAWECTISLRMPFVVQVCLDVGWCFHYSECVWGFFLFFFDVILNIQHD